MNGLVRRYNTFLLTGLFIVIISFGLGSYRTINQANLSQLEFEDNTESPEYRTVFTIEAVLIRYSEIMPLLGLGFLKLGIGFAIATIVSNLRKTGESVRVSLLKAELKIPENKTLFFSRNFIRFLKIGILIELVAAVIMVGWMFTGLSIIDMEFAGEITSESYRQTLVLDRIFEVLAEPTEGLGVAFLIGGISFGLATIIANLSVQATAIPRSLKNLISMKKENDIKDFNPVIPKRLVRASLLGMIITSSGLVPLAIIRAINIVALENFIFSGETGSEAYQNSLVMERIISFSWETWIFVGISIMLFTIGFWLLTIIQYLRTQREKIIELIKDKINTKSQAIEAPLRITKWVPVLLFAGLFWMIFFFVVLIVMRDFSGLTVLSEQFAGRIGSDLYNQNFISQSTLGELIRPGKAISLALIFAGIGLALMTIVINLKLTALMLPESLSKITKVIKGESRTKDETIDNSNVNPMSFAPRKLFFGILLGAIIIISGTFPFAILRIFYTEMFLTEMLSGVLDSSSFQIGKQTQLMLEHFIGPWVAMGTGIIFFSIGRFFSTIVIFVKSRKQIISEGVESAIYFYLEKKESGRSP
jgi:hypothetical protein